jgi:hypothetical protein
MIADVIFVEEAIPCRSCSFGGNFFLSRQDYTDQDNADQRADGAGAKSR